LRRRQAEKATYARPSRVLITVIKRLFIAAGWRTERRHHRVAASAAEAEEVAADSAEAVRPEPAVLPGAAEAGCCKRRYARAFESFDAFVAKK